MSVWTQEAEYLCRYTAGVRDRMIYRNVNGDWVCMHGIPPKCEYSGFKVYRWRWLARIAADWWL